MLSVLIRIDAAGETPMLVEDSETLCPGPGVRWRFVCEVEDREQGHAVVARLKQRPEFWCFDYDREALSGAAAQRPLREPPPAVTLTGHTTKGTPRNLKPFKPFYGAGCFSSPSSMTTRRRKAARLLHWLSGQPSVA